MRMTCNHDNSVRFRVRAHGGLINSSLKIKQNYTKIKKYIQEKQTFYKNQYIYI